MAHTPADSGNRSQGLLGELAERASRFVENTPLNSVVQRLVPGARSGPHTDFGSRSGSAPSDPRAASGAPRHKGAGC